MGKSSKEEDRIDGCSTPDYFKIPPGEVHEEQPLHPSVSSSGSAVRSLLAAVDEELIIRSLRRRLWKAFQNEDAKAAFQIYTATRSEWEDIVCNEIRIAESYIAAEQEREQQEQKLLEHMLEEEQQKRKNNKHRQVIKSCTNFSLPSIIRSSKKLTSSTSLKIHPGDPKQTSFRLESDAKPSIELLALQRMANLPSRSQNYFDTKIDLDQVESPRLVSEKIEAHKGLLQQHMNPSDPFGLDDFKSPFEEYPCDQSKAPTGSNNCCGTDDISTFDETGRAGNANGEITSSSSVHNRNNSWGIQNKRNRNNVQLSSSAHATISRPRQAFSILRSRRQSTDGEGEGLPLFGVPSLENTPSIISLPLGNPDTDSFIGNLQNNDHNRSLDNDELGHAVHTYENRQDVTTPLHEAARLGNSELVRVMLTSAVISQPLIFDCNARNGVGRTVLHCVAGGTTSCELARCIRMQQQQEKNRKVSSTTQAKDEQLPLSMYGIQLPQPLRLAPTNGIADNLTTDNTHHGLETNESSTHARNYATRKGIGAAKSVARFFRMHRRSNNFNDDTNDDKHRNYTVTGNERDDLEILPPPMTEEAFHHLQNDRLTTLTILLSWSHPDDGSANAGMGLSTNAVDSQNRTALHFAAALGRTELCLAICNQFGTLLTVIDSSSQTPCELAGRNHWSELAAQLEARALLYIDPYGTDEELLGLFGNNFAMGSGYDEAAGNDYYTISPAPPFFWFETYSWEKVQQKRVKRISQAYERVQQSVKRLTQNEKIRASILDSDEPAPSFISTIVDLDVETDAYEENPKRFERSGSNSNSIASSGDANDTFVTDNDSGCTTEGLPKSIDTSVSNDIATNLARMALINASHVEMFLTFHGWNLKKAIDAFNDNPYESFVTAKVPLPILDSLKQVCVSNKCEVEPSDVDETYAIGAQGGHVDCLCLICCDSFTYDSENWTNLSGCEHGFCSGCLGEYLMDCAKSKTTGLVVPCPHHECESLLSFEEVKTISSNIFYQADSSTTSVFDSLSATSNERYVLSDSTFRFCPHPGCGSAVRFNVPSYAKASKLTGTGLLELVGAVCTHVRPDTNIEQQIFLPNNHPVTYEGVQDMNYYGYEKQPTKAHRFCFQCGEVGIHWPVPCDRLAEWNEVVSEQVKVVAGTCANGENYNDVAQKLWIQANTKPCPKCNVPIQKDEGCNHMTCRNPVCRYEFCWICRKDWKLHSSETGGFFRCNRWVEEVDPTNDDQHHSAEVPSLVVNEDLNDPRTMEVTYGTSTFDTRESRKKSKEMNRFLHHYERYNAHIESAALELRMGDSACTRLAPVVCEAIKIHGNDHVFQGRGLSFVHAAFAELLECRSMLQHSYAMSFFRYKPMNFSRFGESRRRASEQTAFEQFQAELELMTEQISDVVARSHIRASQSQIMFLTKAAAEKRKEFSNVMINILFEEKQDRQKSIGVRQHGSSDGVRPLALAGVGLDTITGLGNLAYPVRTIGDTTHMERAVRRSLQNFLALSSPNNGLMETEDDDDDAGVDWPCQACTFVNSGGLRCSICGTLR